MPTTLLARAQALLQSRAGKTAALAIVPFAVAAQSAHAQVVITGIEAGWIDMSGSRWSLSALVTGNGSLFEAPGMFSFDVQTVGNSFSITTNSGGALTFNSQLQSGPEPAVPEQSGDMLHRYVTLYGTWPSGQTDNNPGQLSFSITPSFTGTLDSIYVQYHDQAFGNTSFFQPVALGSPVSDNLALRLPPAYQYLVTNTDRGDFRIDIDFGWLPGTYDTSTLLTSEMTFSASVSPIPEPSTYAAMIGAAALGGAIVRRRRRAALV